ncbi:hypothetical protein MHH52_11145 [Paenibacillus sp. FSL K6-0276]|uniref:hypothetical protein n=1 Tax=Paenibacillus sp. FSL K6-0276 TaxID=2921450 RepID=UPI0030EBCE1D
METADKRQLQLERNLRLAEKRLQKASDARRSLPPGSTWARVTTANARWASAAEERDRVQRKLDDHKAASSKDGGT